MAGAYPIESDHHALVTGMVVGCLIRSGISVAPITDDEGNYTAAFSLNLSDMLGEPLQAVIVVMA